MEGFDVVKKVKQNMYTQEEFEEFSKRWEIACKRIWDYARSNQRREEELERQGKRCASGTRFA